MGIYCIYIYCIYIWVYMISLGKTLEKSKLYFLMISLLFHNIKLLVQMGIFIRGIYI